MDKIYTNEEIERLLSGGRTGLVYKHAVLDDENDAIFAAKLLIDFYTNHGKWADILNLSKDKDIPVVSQKYAEDKLFSAFQNYLYLNYSAKSNDFVKKDHIKSFQDIVSELKLLLNGKIISSLDNSIKYKEAVVSRIIDLTLNSNQDSLSIMKLPLDLVLRTNKANLSSLADKLFLRYEETGKNIYFDYNHNSLAIVGLYHSDIYVRLELVRSFTLACLPKNTKKSISMKNVKPLLDFIDEVPEDKKEWLHNSILEFAGDMLNENLFSSFKNLFNNYVDTKSDDLPTSFKPKSSTYDNKSGKPGNKDKPKHRKRRIVK